VRTTRSQEMRARAATRIVIVAAILVVVSLLSVNYFLRADLTARKEYTISDSSRRLLAELPDVVNITVYMSENLPQHMTGFRTRVEDILDEYRAYGGDRLRASFIDPGSDPEREREAQLLGIAPVQLQALERDRAEVVNAYLGMAVRYEDRQKVVPLLLDAERLEYELTSSIVKVMTTSLPVVGFLTGHGERGIDSNYRSVAQGLRQNYDVREVNLTEDPAALDGVTTLVVAGSPHILDTELYEIDQFIMRGGRAVFLLDGVDVPPGNMTASPSGGTLFDYVSRYGATVNADLVVDRINTSAAFQSGFMTLSMPYPYWPKAVAPGLSRENPVVSDLDAVTFPWTSSITLAEELPEGVTATELARSSGYSWIVPPDSNLNPRQRFVPSGPDVQAIGEGRGEGHLLAVALTGELTSAFAGKPLILEEGGTPQLTEPEGKLSRSVPTQIIVIGNARMFEDAFMQQLPSNFIVFLNAVDWLTLGDVLIGIRSRAVVDRPIAEVTDARKATVKSLATFAVPAGLIAFGLVRAATKKKRRARALRLAR